MVISLPAMGKAIYIFQAIYIFKALTFSKQFTFSQDGTHFMPRNDLSVGYRFTERGQLKIYNRIVSSSFSLPDHERLVLLFILDRTVRWRKVFAFISMPEFQNGVFRRRRVVVRGTGLAPELIEQALENLERTGAIDSIRTMSGMAYCINETWCDRDLLERWEINDDDLVRDDQADEEG